jgi:hypothetical protein
MKAKSVMLGAAMAALSAAVVALSPARAETSGTDHATAIEACSAVNPFQPVDALGAIDDGSGIGFSLVWVKDNEDRLWMCDADSQGSIYSYTPMVGDLLDGIGPALIGLQPAANGGFEDEPQTGESLRGLSGRRRRGPVEPARWSRRRPRLRNPRGEHLR